MMNASQTFSTITHLECSHCQHEHASEVLQTVCRRCGTTLVARYDLDQARRAFASTPPESSRFDSMWRYHPVLPIAEESNVVTLDEGWTPLLATSRIGRHVGTPKMLIKEEGRNPTGSFKARGMSAAISKAVELGCRDIALPTAGNAGAAAAAYCARAGLDLHVAMPRDAPPTIIAETRAFGGHVTLVDGLISDAGKTIRAGCNEHGWLDIATLKEPYRLEGKKTLGYELWEQLDHQLPDVILYPTGGGTGLIGMWKAFRELSSMGLLDGDRLPRLFAVQSTGCAPVVEAFDHKAKRIAAAVDAETLAPGIRVPHPFADRLILETLEQSHGGAIAVEDEAILEMSSRTARLEGIDPAPEGAATIAAVEQLVGRREISPHHRVVAFNTGTGLKHPELRNLASPEPKVLPSPRVNH